MKFLKVLSKGFLGLGVILLIWILSGMLIYSPQYVLRVLAWQDSDAFDWQKFPSAPLKASSNPHTFPSSPDAQVSQRFASLAGVTDWESFLAENHTQAFIVIRDEQVIYEQYFNGASRESIVTSFSVAKSYTSALIGFAIQDGYLNSLDDPITVYLPELAERDQRFTKITIRNLLRMSSGLDYVEFRPFLFNSDDALTTYYPDQRKISLQNTRIIESPGQVMLYNKYHPQLLGLILERATGRRVTQYLQEKLWEPLGMEYDGSWSTDSRSSDFEKMETGVNARALDFARFGALFLNNGSWQGRQVLSSAWVEESTQPYLPENYAEYYPDYFQNLPGKAYYNQMWWGFAREDGRYDYAAMGDKGQYIYISPENNLVILRFGIDYGIPSSRWVRLFYDFAGR